MSTYYASEGRMEVWEGRGKNEGAYMIIAHDLTIIMQEIKKIHVFLTESL